MSHLHLKWPGFTTINTLLISVDKHEFGIRSEPVEYADKVFVPKQEAHITVFGSELGTHLLQQFIHHPEVEQQLSQAFENTDWSYTKTDDLRHLVRVKSEDTGEDVIEETIIMLVEMKGMARFYEKLKVLGLITKDHPVPPPHVTLYTRNCDLGIGVDSESELTELSRDHLDDPF